MVSRLGCSESSWANYGVGTDTILSFNDPGGNVGLAITLSPKGPRIEAKNKTIDVLVDVSHGSGMPGFWLWLPLPRAEVFDQTDMFKPLLEECVEAGKLL